MKLSIHRIFQFLTLIILVSYSGGSKIQWQAGTFIKPKENPILQADSTLTFFCPVNKRTIKWQKADVFNPAAIVKNNKVYLVYRCEDNPKASIGGRTSRLGLASSEDGIHFTKYKEPVLYPDNDEFKIYDYPGGCEDPRIVETEEGKYIITYTSWNQKLPRLSIAVSEDLIHWKKTGPAFKKAYNGKLLNTWSKSGSIITKMKKNKQIAAKVNGKYWMYWGEHGINLAWSENLTDWYPTLDEKGNLKLIVKPREHMFDSDLTECGPPAIITKQGILLLYNGKNATSDKASPDLPKGTYSVGQILFDVNNMEQVIERSDKYLIKPTLPHEISGQYQAGTVFAEGMVFFNRKWHIYYGTADSFVGVVIKD